MNEATSEAREPVETQRGRKRVLALAAVALPMVVLFGPAMFSDRLFAMRDAGHYYYPLFNWCADEWGAGRLPLWNPLENCGTAIHADPTASIWYPGKLAFTLPLDFSVNYKLYIVGHVVLCAITAYWLARKWGGSRYPAALAALSYSCGGSVVFQHANVVYLVGAAWLPVAVGLIDDILRQQRARSAVWLGVVLALMVLGGDPQMAYHVLLVAAIYATILLARRIPTFELRREMRHKAVWGGGLVAVGAAVAFCLAAIQILPSAEAARQSERAQYDQPRNLYESADHLYSAWQDPGPTLENLKEVRAGLLGVPAADTHHASVYDYSVVPWRLAEFVLPNIGGRMFPTHRRWFSLLPDESRIWTPTLYMGLLPLVLGLSVFSLRSDDLRIRWLSWTVGIFVLGSLGTFGLGWLVRHAVASTTGASSPIGDGVGGVYWLLVVFLPKYVLFRYPAKLLVVAALCISQLAAIGWDGALAERSLSQPPRRVIWLLTVLGIASGAAAFGALVAAQFIVLGAGHADPVFGPFDNGGAWIDIVSALTHTSIVSLACAWLLQRASVGRQPTEKSGINSRWPKAALLAVCSLELTFANRWLVPTAPAALWRERSAVAAAIGDASEAPRLCRDAIRWPQEFSIRGSPHRLEELVRWERDTLAGRYALLDRIGQVNINEPAGQVDYESIRAWLLTDDTFSRLTTHPYNLERLHVGYALLDANQQLNYAAKFADRKPGNAGLWRLDQSGRRVETPDDAHVHILRGVDATEARLLFIAAVLMGDADRKAGRLTSVEGDLKLFDKPQVVKSGNPPTATVAFETPNLVTVQARLPWWNLVVLNDRHADGWKAHVTSHAAQGTSSGETPIYRANGIFRSVYLPAGEHTIEFRYEPPAFYRGAWISGVSWVVLVLVGIFALIRRLARSSTTGTPRGRGG